MATYFFGLCKNVKEFVRIPRCSISMSKDFFHGNNERFRKPLALFT